MCLSQERLALGDFFGKELKGEFVSFYFNPKEKMIQIIPTNNPVDVDDGFYLIKELKIDEKGRIVIPSSLRKVFPDVSYLPALRDGKLYILII